MTEEELIKKYKYKKFNFVSSHKYSFTYQCENCTVQTLGYIYRSEFYPVMTLTEIIKQVGTEIEITDSMKGDIRR